MKKLQLKNRGSTIPLALVALVLLLLMGMSLLSQGHNTRVYSIRTSSDIAAQCAADAGLTKALFEMNKKLKTKLWSDENLPTATNTSLANCDAVYNYKVTDVPGIGYRIESTGISIQNTKKVSCTLKLQGPFDAAIFTENGISLYSTAIIDGYNYEEGDEILKIGTNSTNSGAVDLRNLSVVNGDVMVGMGGNPDDVIENNGTITGETGTLTQEYDMPSITVPEWLLSLPSSGIIKNNTTIQFSAKYDSIDLNSGNTITIDGDVVMYIAGDMTIKSSAELLIKEDASLTLYLGGNFEGKNSSDINNETKLPNNLKIYGLDDCESMIFKNSSDFYGSVYAPNANVEMKNSSDVYGSVISKSFDQKNSASFYYDASLRDVNVDDEAVRFVVTDWREE